MVCRKRAVEGSSRRGGACFVSLSRSAGIVSVENGFLGGAARCLYRRRRRRYRSDVDPARHHGQRLRQPRRMPPFACSCSALDDGCGRHTATAYYNYTLKHAGTKCGKRLGMSPLLPVTGRTHVRQVAARDVLKYLQEATQPMSTEPSPPPSPLVVATPPRAG